MVEKGRSNGHKDEDFRLAEGIWTALIVAASEVVEMLREDVDEMRAGVPTVETNLAELMPRRFIPKYDVSFAERLAQTAADLAERLDKARGNGLTYPHATFLNSVAEEMLLSRTIQLAIDRSGSVEEAEELEALQELSFEDRDFEWLYDFSHDGVTDDPEVSRLAGFANLSFDDWFQPFR